MVAFSAVPDVIKAGKVVAYDSNWKGRGKETAIIAAPVNDGENVSLIAVVVTRSNQKQRYYTHSIVELKMDDTHETGTYALAGKHSGGDSSIYNSIAQSLDEYDRENPNNKARSRDTANRVLNIIDELPEHKHFSLSVDEPVQQTKDLIAVHNLDEENLDISETAQKNVRNEDFSYNTLVNKPDIPIHFYKNMGMKTIPNGATRDQLISATQENIAKYNKETGRPEYGSSYLYSKDIGAPVLINKKGIRHGMNRVSNLNANVHTALPLYFENAIVTNTANSSVGDNADFSYILNSAYKDDGGIHIVTINVFHSAKGYYASIDDIRDELYSIRESKKTEATAHSATSTDQNGLSSFMASTINIAQLLDQVKETRARGDLSLDVLKHFNLDRDGNTITGLRHSLNIDDDIDAVFDDDLDEPFDDHTVSSIRGEDVLKEGEEALGSIHVSAADTYRLAQKLVSDYGLSGQTRALNADLQKVFDYMEKNKGNLNTRVLNGVINALARPYIDSITETVGSGEYDDIMSSL